MVAVDVTRRVCSGRSVGWLTWWVRSSAQGWEVEEEWLSRVESSREKRVVRLRSEWSQSRSVAVFVQHFRSGEAGSSEGFLVEDAGSQRSGRSVRAQEIITRTARRLVGSLKQREALGLEAQAPESKELSGCRCDEALDSLLDSLLATT